MMPSPCTGICRLDLADRFCVGCLRTLDEIVGWAAMTDEQRCRVLGSLEHRRAGAGYSTAAGSPGDHALASWSGGHVDRG